MLKLALAVLLSCTAFATYAAQDKEAMYQHYISNAKKLVWSGNVKANKTEFITAPPEGLDKTIAYIPDIGAKRVLRYGMLSGAAQACGLNWQPHYKSLMAYQRNKMKRNPYQMAYIGVLHGAGMSITEKKPCDVTTQKDMVAQHLKSNVKRFRK